MQYKVYHHFECYFAKDGWKINLLRNSKNSSLAILHNSNWQQKLNASFRTKIKSRSQCNKMRSWNRSTKTLPYFTHIEKTLRKGWCDPRQREKMTQWCFKFSLNCFRRRATFVHLGCKTLRKHLPGKHENRAKQK